MLVSGQSMKLYSGRFGSRADESDQCGVPLQEVYEFRTEVPYDRCGGRETVTRAQNLSDSEKIPREPLRY